MKGPLLKQDKETIWYENHERIQEYLNNSREKTVSPEDNRFDKLSRLKMTKKPTPSE